MMEDSLRLPSQDVRKLLGACSPDGALVYLYLKSGGDLDAAQQTLRLPRHRIDCALASLRQLGLYEDDKQKLLERQPPVYTENDVAREMQKGKDFGRLVGEAQRRLGRILSTEELKILLSIQDYLGLPAEVVGTLITHCLNRNRLRGVGRTPSLRNIEKEAYKWADDGIDTLEEAAFYVQQQEDRQTRAARIQHVLQLEGRRLTQGEERYVTSWLDMGFGEAEIALAYEKTCLNTGGLKWPYCNSILKSWHEKGLHRVAEIQSGDAKPAAPRKQAVPMGSTGELGDLEREAIARLKRDFAQEG